MDGEIANFLSSQFILSLSTFESPYPYATPLYYVFFKNHLFFLSDKNTKHAQDILKNQYVAASIHNHTREVSRIQGIQLQGICKFLEDTGKIAPDTYFTLPDHGITIDVFEAYQVYLDTFPEAKGLSSSLWFIFPQWIKFTDNRIFFGYKKIWRYRDDFRN